MADTEDEVKDDNQQNEENVLGGDESIIASMRERLDALESQNNEILGALKSIRDTQAIMVDMGAIIKESESSKESKSDNTDSFVPLESLDFTI